jgi:hypothetical protein
MKMKRALYLIPLLTLMLLLSAGCYTKFYRPGMETAGGTNETLYNRNDSTAIDTTLTQDTSQYYDTYTYPDSRWDSWSYWGRPRGVTRWGFDFNNFSPDYYWSYYGYYDYYGTPWWSSWYSPWYGYYPGGTTGPSEPPSQRPRGRRDQDNSGTYSAPSSTTTTSPAYSQPNNSNNPAPTSKSGNDTKQQSGGSDSNKRDGKKGR